MASKHRRWPRVLAGIASAIVLLFTGVAWVGATAFRALDSNISSQATANSSRGSDGEEPPDFQPGEPLNILVMGTDSRSVLNTEEYGNPEEIDGARSDTTILVHIAADRKSATAVSIPRDTIVDIPSCPRYVDGPSEPVSDRFNEAFNIAGPFCTVKTVEKLSGVEIDHFMIVDFNGFKGVVDALDGVEVCLKEPVDDPLSGLKLPAGTSVVQGDDALAFVRARYTLGDGSDLSRIERQQAFLASALRKATSIGVLANPVTTYRVLDEVTKSITVDESISGLRDLTNLALSLSDMRPADVTFVTLPTVYNDDGATVSPDPALADPLWQSLKDGTPWPPEPTVPEGDDTPLVVPSKDITVRVLNGTDRTGAAARVADLMTKMGYNVVEVGDFDSPGASSTSVQYPPGYAEAARTLAYAAGADLVGEDLSGLESDVLTLVIGSDFTGIRPVVADPTAAPAKPGEEPQPSPSTTGGVPSTTGDTLICS
ncbi:MAG: LCP family protein [Actinobacteria bacterium]|nr:LCP family protein [Actinomycetota bacterium]